MKKAAMLVAVVMAVGAFGVPSVDAGAVVAPKGGGHGFLKGAVAVDGPAHRHRYRSLGKVRRVASGHRVTFNVLDRRGRAPATADAPEVYVTSLDGREWLTAPLNNGTVTGELPAGDYVVQVYVVTPDDGGVRSTTLVYLSRYSVRRDGVLVLDARAARPVSAEVADRPDARVLTGSAAIVQRIGAETINMASMDLPNAHLTPVDDAPGLALQLHAKLTRDGAESGSPYLFDLARQFDGVPSDPVLRAHTRDLAAVRTRHTAPGPNSCAGGHSGVDWGTGVVFLPYAPVGNLPVTRTEYFTPGLNWRFSEGVTTTGCDWENQPPEVTQRARTFPRPGAYTATWNNAPFGPAPGLFRWNPEGDAGSEPDIQVPMLASWGTHAYLARYVPYLTGGTTLYDERGEVVAATNHPGDGNVLTTPRTGRHRLVVDARHRAPWTELSSSQRVTWSFDAPGTAMTAFPLPVVRYDTTLDDHNRARAGTVQPVALAVEQMTPDGRGTAPAKVEALTLSVSTDDGATWKDVGLRRDGDRWLARIPSPASGHVSFRSAARTVEGTSVDQTLVHAYGVR